MTLTEGISAIQGKFQNYLADGIAFARHDQTADESRSTSLYRITDVRVVPEDVLLVIHPEPISLPTQSGAVHMTVGELLGRLTALPAEYANYSLEACEPEVEIKEENVRLRFDYPIVTTGRLEGLVNLCLLAAIEQPRKGRPKSSRKPRART